MNNFELVLRFVLAAAGVWFIFHGLQVIVESIGVLCRQWKANDDRTLCVGAGCFMLLMYGAVVTLGAVCLFVACCHP